MLEYISIFVKFLGVSASVTAAAAWLIQKISGQLLSRDIEKFKATLEREAIEFKIKFKRIHEERANVIKELHRKIVDTYDTFTSYISPLQITGEAPMDEKDKLAVETFNDLQKYFKQNSIFLSKDMDQEVQALINQFKNCLIDYQGIRRADGPNSKVDSREWLNAWNMLTKQVSITTSQVKEKFRELIGIN